MTKAGPPFVRDLRDELVAAAERKIAARKRRHRNALNGLAALLIVVVAVGVLQFNAKPSTAGVLSVTRSNGLIYVDLKSTSATPQQIADELNRYGIDADVNAVPVSGSGIGRFVTVNQAGNGFGFPSSTYFEHFTLADKDNQKILLSFGRVAQPHETYVKLVNAYEKGEPLHCSKTRGRQVRDIIGQLQALNMELRWQGPDGIGISRINTPPFPDYFITGAVSDKPNSLLIYVSPESTALFNPDTDCA